MLDGLADDVRIVAWDGEPLVGAWVDEPDFDDPPGPVVTLELAGVRRAAYRRIVAGEVPGEVRVWPSRRLVRVMDPQPSQIGLWDIALRNSFYAVSGMDYGQIAESDLVDPFLALYEDSELPQLAETIETFVSEYGSHLESIYDDAPEAHDLPLLLLPSALLIFERLSARRMLLESRWHALDWPNQVLADLTAIWADGHAPSM